MSEISVGKKIANLKITQKPMTSIAIKEPVFPFKRFPNVDTILGPEMKSTGEVMSIDKNMEAAFIKCQMAASNPLPVKGNLFVSVKDSDKAKVLPIVRSFKKHGFKIFATQGTAEFLNENSIKVTFVNKVAEGSPHIVDLLDSDEISIVINTTETRKSINDSFGINKRKSSADYRLR